MDNEYTKIGEVATIRGDFFYQPLTVKFAGGGSGELVSVKDKEIQVRVPAGAQPGQITIKTNFGETKSDFWFRDNRNLLITNDPWTGWWGQDMVIASSDPLAISGNFSRITKSIGAWRNAGIKGTRVEFYAPYKGHSSANDFVEFYKNDKTLFQKDVTKEKLYQ